MAQLKNCSSCGDIFAAVSRDICPYCYAVEEQKFQCVYQFLMKRKNRQANLQQIVEGTGVDENLVVQFLQPNRLRVLSSLISLMFVKIAVLQLRKESFVKRAE